MKADAKIAPPLVAETARLPDCDLASLAETPVDEARFLEARGFFDKAYYLKGNPDIAAAGADPFEHYMTQGFSEGRNPSPDFDANFYARRYLDGDYSRNPLLHYLSLADRSGILTKPSESDQTIPNLVKKFSKPGDAYEELRPLPRAAARKAKVLAYYLTQFHPIAENDRWWGEGFTEWTNIARGVPRFENHFQPRIPRDLGFYNLLDLGVMRRQAAMAKSCGVYGFVYYYYNFNNHRLLEKPLEAFLAAPDIDMPFALMWANENWTRRWDGMESEILIKQDYRAEDDRALCADFLRHFCDPRYIRAAGRPLLMIYRPALIPKAKERLAAWRRIFGENGEDPILVMSQAFDDTDPSVYGMDGAIEFPPHKLTSGMERVNGRLKFFDDAFSGNVFAYDDVVERSLNEPAPSFPLIKTATPNWDNDARRQGDGLCLHGSTPRKYERWLSELVDRAAQRPFFGEPFVCVNAWNEWCEGAYLEPDVHYGAAYLNATGRAATGAVARPFRLLLVGHDAFPFGAQHLLLNIGKTLKGALGLDIHFVLLDGGELEEAYRAIAPLTVLTTLSNPKATLAGLVRAGFSAALVNTCAAASLAPALRALGARSVLLVHELPRLLREKSLEGVAREGITHAETVVFPSRFVKDRVLEALGSPAMREAIVLPQGLYKMLQPNARAAARVREELGIAAGEPLVLGAGYADMRKGFDLFLQIWRLCQQHGAKVHFCWIGAMDLELIRWLAVELAEAMQTGTFHLPGYRADVEGFYAAANAFALTSREDPFPSVALEALSLGVPVVAFEGSGGIPDLLEDEDLGVVVKYGDAPLFAQSLTRLIRREPDTVSARRMRRFIEERFCFADYVRDLVVRAMPDLPSVTVAVPNYNYAAYMRERLNSVFDQTHPIEDVIVLDDASTDESVKVIEEVAQERKRDLTLIINEANSGSVFKQWAAAVEAARGEFIWIAEADDGADPRFLSQILALMKQDPAIQLGFCDSQSVDGEGKPIYDSYKPYFATLEPDALRRNEIFDGPTFVARFLSVKNVILNVSSVVWRREALARALDVCEDHLERFRMAGDWRLYLEALASPSARVAYVAAPLNIHRRHAASVTHSLKAQSHIDEVADIHRWLQDRGATPSSVAAAQRAYLVELKQQFGLAAAAGALASPLFRVETTLPDFSESDLEIADEIRTRADHSHVIEYRSNAVQSAVKWLAKSNTDVRIYPGKRAERTGCHNVLIVAHFAGEFAFGSERSFLDMIDAIDALNVNLIVVLPRNVPDYTNLIRKAALKVIIVNYGWWREGTPIDHAVVAKFKQLLITENISAVHINTIMLRECAIAARDCHIPTVVHVRELVTNDVQLCTLIGHSPSEIIAEVRERADWIIGNSQTTADAFWKVGKTFIIPNTIDVATFSNVRRDDSVKLRIGLISSNIEKKGVNDFAELARLAAQEGLEAEFRLIGPLTEPIKQLQAQQLEDSDLRLLVFAGYSQTPADAVGQVDVVVNFSHFTESFGRTVLEAMAARRPVIAYDWGALGELVRHGETGYLIPYLTPKAALPHIRTMCEDPHLVARLGERGHQFSMKYDISSYKKQFAEAYAKILPEHDRRIVTSAPTVMRARAWPKDSSADKPLRLAYFCWHFPVPSETFVLNELEELKRRGVDVIVFCRQSPHKTFKPKFEIEFHQIKSVDDLAESLIRTKRNMVHAHFVFPTVTNMVWPACEKAGVPFTFIAHAQDIFVYKNGAQCRLDEIGLSKYCRRLFTLSQFHYDYIVSLGFPREKVAINPNAVAVPEEPISSGDESPKAELSKKVISIHRFVEKKGIHHLIKAASILDELGLTFEIYGYGDCEGDYRKLIAELKLTNVEIKGPLPNDQVISVLKTADLFASPCVRTATGDMDGIPTSVVESMVAGVPVLTTAIAGLPDLVRDEVTGIVCEANAASVASAIRRFYGMDTLKRRFMIKNARRKAQEQHDRVRTVDILLRVWRDEGVDVVVVSWNNIKELQMVVDRILANTALPLHLIVCDNNSQKEPIQEFLQHVWREDDRVTVVLNTQNAMVGPGTNLAAAQGHNETIIYVCGKEGVSFRNGWELPFVRAFETDPGVGLVGTVGYSPTYLTGSQFPTGIRLFEHFRNKDFALNNPDRLFGHIQGGLFAIRRSMFDKIGGFSEIVPHDYTDVEYSFYAESQGWKFAEPEGVLALFNKTRPTLSQRFDENVVVAHPVLPEQIENFEGVRAGRLRHCNMCDWFGESFSADGYCPQCLSSAQDRTLFRWLSESPFMYRRLIALCIGMTGEMQPIATQNFQGPNLTLAELLAELKTKQRLPARPKSAGLALIRVPRLAESALGLMAKELRRILGTGAKSIFQIDVTGAEEWHARTAELADAMKKAGHAFEKEVRYTSRATGLDYRPLIVFRRLP